MPKPDFGQPLDGLLLRLGRVCAVEQERQRGVFDRRQDRQQVEELEYEADLAAAHERERIVGHGRDRLPVDADRPAGGPIEPAEQVQQGGLAAATRAHHRDKLARVHDEFGVIEGDDSRIAGAVHFGEFFRLNERHAKLP